MKGCKDRGVDDKVDAALDEADWFDEAGAGGGDARSDVEERRVDDKVEAALDEADWFDEAGMEEVGTISNGPSDKAVEEAHDESILFSKAWWDRFDYKRDEQLQEWAERDYDREETYEEWYAERLHLWPCDSDVEAALDEAEACRAHRRAALDCDAEWFEVQRELRARKQFQDFVEREEKEQEAEFKSDIFGYESRAEEVQVMKR